MPEPKLDAPARTITWGGRQLRWMGVPLVRLDESSLLNAASKKPDFLILVMRDSGMVLDDFSNRSKMKLS